MSAEQRDAHPRRHREEAGARAEPRYRPHQNHGDSHGQSQNHAEGQAHQGHVPVQAHTRNRSGRDAPHQHQHSHPHRQQHHQHPHPHQHRHQQQHQRRRSSDRDREVVRQAAACVLVVGDYELRKKLGQGSFGSVFLCKHRQTGFVACAKLEDLRTTAPQVEYEYKLYRSLAKTAARTFVPAVYDHGRAGDFRYVVMDVGGTDLSAVTATHSDREKLRLMSSCLDALRAVHDAGVVHRDLKPKNMLLKTGTRDQVMLIDFGLAKGFRLGGRHIVNQRKGTIAGTARYASVPCLMGTQTSRRDDLYGLCYSMAALFGQPLPWQSVRGATKEERQQKTLELKRTLEPRAVFHSCPAPLARIYLRVLQLGFAQRPDYEKYQELLRA